MGKFGDVKKEVKKKPKKTKKEKRLEKKLKKAGKSVWFVFENGFLISQIEDVVSISDFL